MGSGLLLAGLAGFVVISSWIGTPANRAPGGTDRVENKTAPATESQAAAQPQVIPSASAPRPQVQASKPDVKPTAGSLPVHTDDRDYLPPEAVYEPKASASDKPPGRARETGKRYVSIPRKSAAVPQPRQDQPHLPRPEQQRVSRPSKSAHQNVQSYICLGWPPHPRPCESRKA